MRISDWSSDVCSSDLCLGPSPPASRPGARPRPGAADGAGTAAGTRPRQVLWLRRCSGEPGGPVRVGLALASAERRLGDAEDHRDRSEEHTSELQSLMRISYAVFCLKKHITTPHEKPHHTHPTTPPQHH